MSTCSARPRSFFVVFVFIVTACVIWSGWSLHRQQASQGKQRLQLSAWIVDWHHEASLTDLNALSGQLASLQSFAVYFSEHDKLLFTDDFHHMLPQVQQYMQKQPLVRHYLTVVNDIKAEDGSSIQKDSQLVSRLVSTEPQRQQHINDIVEAVVAYGFDGAEIDYEKIAADDWTHVIVFYNELFKRLAAEGKSLRIVLEARAPIEKLDWPEGPDYIMMAYNLYGPHSGPGPKADYKSITELSKRIQALPGSPYLALSAGGFDWSDDGNVSALTYVTATELSKKAIQPSQRDEASGSLFFYYMDEQQVMHTVWYADNRTAARWVETAAQNGISHIALWRLGETGNTFHELLQ